MGRVKSLERNVYSKDGKFRRRKKENILVPVSNTDGYLAVKLCTNGTTKTICIHILVAMAFVDNPNNLPEVNHIDTNRKNNIASNLEWCSHIDNIKHSVKMGHYKRYGERNSNYKGTKLKNFYKLNPDKKKLLARPGKQNGMATPIFIININTGFIMEFSYIRECALFFINNNVTQKSKNYIANCIKKHIVNKTPYLGYMYYYL